MTLADGEPWPRSGGLCSKSFWWQGAVKAESTYISSTPVQPLELPQLEVTVMFEL